MKDEDYNKIERYIKGESDIKEQASVESLFLEGEKNLYFRNRLKEDWESLIKSDAIPYVNLSNIHARIYNKIIKNELLKKQEPWQKFLRLYLKSAAILLIPLLVAGGLGLLYLKYMGSTKTENLATYTIIAPMGSRVSFSLPDGTTGMLNSGSNLKYSVPFTPRNIDLKGEGWFEVKHDEHHPFEINAGNSTIKVLGTSLDISAYPSEDYVEVVLKEGKVEFFNKKNNEKTTMLPSERLVFQNGQTIKSEVDPSKYSSWTEGKLVFRGDLMAEVARRIERWYNIKIELADQKIEKYSFHATFLDDKLEDVLNCLSMTSPIGYRITPRILGQNGTYEREKVTIYYKK